ncbi:MAG TPA: response regulator [Ktedonobacteraceae bacterium]
MIRQSENELPTILIIDDDSDIVDFLRDLLKMEGYEVMVTIKGDEVEQFQRRELPDLILLDVFLSGKDGREIVAFLKQKEETRHIPVIMFSAYAQTEETARQAGANDFVSKPFDLEVFLTKVRNLLE